VLFGGPYNTGMHCRATPRHRRLPRCAALAAACTVGLAACGTAASGGTTSVSANGGPALQFAKCMRAHGVTHFPDPGSRGGGIQLSSGINPGAPVFQAAQKACGRYLPNAATPSTLTPAQYRAGLRFAACMRAHGVPNFPDPLSGSRSPTGLALSLDGVTFAVSPSIQPRSPAFQHAAADCGVRPPGAPKH